MQFNSFNLSKQFVDNLTHLGYNETTQIQSDSIKYILDKKDIIAKAKTGSGKTLSFAIGVVNSLDMTNKNPQSLIIVPTRELANQVYLEIKGVAKYLQNIRVTTIVGGEPLKAQVKALTNGTHIIVATPGRLLDHLEKETLSIKQINTLVLDEADKMLELGFLEDIQKIIRNMSINRHTMLFSATFTSEIMKLSKSIQTNAISIETHSIIEKLTEHYCKFEEDNKFETLKLILNQFTPQKSIIFCMKKIDVEELADKLFDNGYSPVTLQGDLEQIERYENLIQFSNGSANILVATDLASRGLDIDGVDLVINYDYPKDIIQYTHRIGRTGRMNKSGTAITLLNSNQYLTPELEDRDINEIILQKNYTKAYIATMQTLIIKKYRKNKIRAGDIVGTLTKTKEINGTDIGDINISDNYAYVAIISDKIDIAYKILQTNKIKGIKFKIYKFNG